MMLTSYVKAYIENLRTREEGATMIEYGLLAALIAVALIATVVLVQNGLNGAFTDVADGLSN